MKSLNGTIHLLNQVPVRNPISVLRLSLSRLGRHDPLDSIQSYDHLPKRDCEECCAVAINEHSQEKKDSFEKFIQNAIV